MTCVIPLKLPPTKPPKEITKSAKVFKLSVAANNNPRLLANAAKAKMVLEQILTHYDTGIVLQNQSAQLRIDE